MLALDHIPFQAPDLPALAAAFAALGFTVSPPSFYTSPDDPTARWNNRCVFLQRGWFDLLQAPGAPPAVGPASVLFLTADLDATAAELGDLRQLPAYRLVRRWEDRPAHQPFRLISIRERISPLGLALIEHADPCVDALPDWFAHPNAAIEAAGLIFAGAQPSPFAPAAGRVLDLGGFEYWEPAAFRHAFGEGVDCAVRVRVRSLEATRSALAADLAAVQSSGRLHVAAPSPLNCGFQFFEA
ncbi:MAG: hypothetical protein C0481_20750 [Phenylobacterium sp.]|uniref:VOC family protein n=1 Tax=Phenylobacterium sp. TaxID=1871053 RepID=UPI0025DA03C8|nr:VOC family protein [Phenylobacterium sp.]MBA4014297.1 hypothetical protein [Phenylobacterium sp.]